VRRVAGGFSRREIDVAVGVFRYLGQQAQGGLFVPGGEQTDVGADRPGLKRGLKRGAGQQCLTGGGQGSAEAGTLALGLRRRVRLIEHGGQMFDVGEQRFDVPPRVEVTGELPDRCAADIDRTGHEMRGLHRTHRVAEHDHIGIGRKILPFRFGAGDRSGQRFSRLSQQPHHHQQFHHPHIPPKLRLKAWARGLPPRSMVPRNVPRSRSSG
jgi:hypothetical protein